VDVIFLAVKAHSLPRSISSGAINAPTTAPSTDDRLDELAAILALGVHRLKSKQSREEGACGSETSLDFHRPRSAAVRVSGRQV
jgi:hypothetical protein